MKRIAKQIKQLPFLKSMTAFYVMQKLLVFFAIYAAAGMLQQFLLTVFFFACGYDPVHGVMPDEKIVTAIMYYAYALYGLAAVGYGRIVEKRSMKTMGFSGGIGDFGMGAFAAVILFGAVLIFSCLIGEAEFAGCGKDLNVPYLMLLAGGFLVQSAAEEIMCRGFLMTSLMRRISVPTAIFWSSTAFALPHFGTLFTADLEYAAVGVLNLYLISAVLALLMLRRKSVWIACGLHGAWNFWLNGICGLTLSGNEAGGETVLRFEVVESSLANGGVYGLEAGLVTTAVLGIGAAILAAGGLGAKDTEREKDGI